MPTAQLLLAQPDSDICTTVSGAGAQGFRSVRFWHDQLFAKPARHGGGVAWCVRLFSMARVAWWSLSLRCRHQDYSYWTRTTPMNHMVRRAGVLPSACLRAAGPQAMVTDSTHCS